MRERGRKKGKEEAQERRQEETGGGREEERTGPGSRQPLSGASGVLWTLPGGEGSAQCGHVWTCARGLTEEA